MRGNAGLVTDGAVAPEGAQWDAPVAITLDTGAGSITYDLGQPTAITALYVQADANDTYKVQGSLDGVPGSFKPIAEIENALDRGHGLRARWVRIPPISVRFLRVGEGGGDGFFSIAEFAAYCQAPTPFPPVMRQAEAPLASVVKRPWYKFDWWEDHASARVEMALALLALLLLWWDHRAERPGRARKNIVLSPSVPTMVARACIAFNLALAIAIDQGTAWLPRWATIVACYLSCEFTLMVTPRSTGFITPLEFVVRWLRARAPSPSGEHRRPAASITA
ncbi:MAG: discoidin domain-containing protein, partial [Pseudomonadota bacterium]